MTKTMILEMTVTIRRDSAKTVAHLLGDSSAIELASVDYAMQLREVETRIHKLIGKSIDYGCFDPVIRQWRDYIEIYYWVPTV